MEFYYSGHVVTMECFEKLIKKDMIHPLTSTKLKEKDIIPLQRVSIIDLHHFIDVFIYSLYMFHSQGGTGYSQTNEQLEAKEKRPALMS